MHNAVRRMNGEGPTSARTTSQRAPQLASSVVAPASQQDRQNGREGAGAGEEDGALALAAARDSLLRVSGALRTLLQACTRARAVVENAPEAARLDRAGAT